MRRTRWLLLLAISAILAAIGALYQAQKRSLETHAPPKPAVLPSQMAGLRDDFQYTRSDAGRVKFEISAQKVSQQKDSSQVQLEQVALKIFNKTGDKYDLVNSVNATFDQNASRMYAEGKVVITLAVPVEGTPARQLVRIESSGVTFDVKTGQEFVTTDRPTHFTFENGTGDCVGASYDPTKRELTLRQHAEIDWKAPTPRAPPLKIEAGELVYKEAEATVSLNGWARLTRENTIVNAASSIVHLQDDVIRQVDAVKAQGTDSYPKRKLEYGADELHVAYNEYGEVEHISGRNNARLVSSSAGSETAMTSDVVDLDIETVNGESVLKRALGNGHAMIVSKPVAAPDGNPPETHVVHSDVIEVKMRTGGREVESVQTQAPGRLDFLANQPAQHPRHLDADRMTMIYGPSNQLESFRAVNVHTETEPSAEERARKKQDVSKTRSRNLSAQFDPKTGQMKHMEQWDGFVYEDGDRRATANRATLEQDQDRNLMSLDQAARVWDATGTTSADRILIDQKTGDFTAEGHVSSSRLPDKKTSPSGMLAGNEPVEAMAAHMTSANHNHLLHYEGHVVMWQGADRISADRTDVDRDKRMVGASGNVTTQFREKKPVAQAPAGTAAGPTFVVVTAGNLVYTDQDRLAHYTGGVVLTRPLLEVDADDLRAVLAPQNNDKAETKNDQKEDADEDQSRLEKAYADGHVKIVQAATDRTRTGTSDHAEYFTDNERIVLRGGQPQMLDSKKGFVRGAELTYYVNDDRLLVSGSPQQRATGRLRRKP
jgi:lipopolysaccharide export system protein LptA